MIVGVALERIRPALERDVDRGAGGVPLLRVEGRGLDLELLDRAGRRHEGDATAVGHVGRAVERELVAARPAVGREVGGPAVVEGARELEVAVIRHAGGEAREHEGVAVGERHQGDPLLVDDLTGRSAPRLQQGRVRCDGDGFLELTDFEREIERQAVADSDLDTAHVLLESLELDGHPVATGCQVGNREIAVGIGRRRGLGVGGDVDDGDGGTREPASLRVRDAAADCAPEILRVSACRRGPGQQREQCRANDACTSSHMPSQLTRARERWLAGDTTLTR